MQYKKKRCLVCFVILWCVCVRVCALVYVCAFVLWVEKKEEEKKEREPVHIWLFQVFSAWIEARSRSTELPSAETYDEDDIIMRSRS